MTLLKSFLNEWVSRGELASHQIASFNDFIYRRLQKTVDEISKITVELPTGEELTIKLGKVHIEKPQIREADGSVREVIPHEARLRNLTYSAPIFVEMTPVFEEREHDTEVVEIGELPVMVRSDLCQLSKLDREGLIRAGEDPYDPGGYFIINGTERVLILSEEIAPNKLILQKRGNVITARINAERAGYVQRHVFERKSDGVIAARFANLIRTPVSVVALMKGLGMETDQEIIDAIARTEADKEAVYINLYDAQLTSQEEALDYIGRRMKIMQKEQRIERAQQILDNYLLAHLGTGPNVRMKKAHYLGIVLRKMIMLRRGDIHEDDIDHYANKRLKLAGDLLELLFRSIILGRWGLIARLQYNYQKMMKRGRKLLRLQSVIVSDVLTKQIMRSMATGNWVGGKTGVSQRLERHNFVRAIAHLRSVVSPLSPTQEHFEARELHATQFGRLCAVRTPEGQSIGLRNFLAVGAEVTISPVPEEEKAVIAFLKAAGVRFDEVKAGATEIYVDGRFIGSHSSGKQLAAQLANKRRSGQLPLRMNVAHFPDREEVQISLDSGRVRRPLIIVDGGKSRLTKELATQIEDGKVAWQDLLKKRVIEYLDAEEEENTLIAMRESDLTKEHTHLEIDPVLMLGVDAALLVYPEKDRGDRLNYGSRMIVQAIGMYLHNYLLRDDTTSQMLVYPQTPLVTTDAMEATGLSTHPAGQNVVIAILPYYCYNMLDAIILNKASLDRGLGRALFYRVYTTEGRRYWGGQEDKIEVPGADVRGFRSTEEYKNLDDDAIIPPEREVAGNDVLVGKTSPLRFLGVAKEIRMGIKNRRENSLTVNAGEPGIVEKVIVTDTENGNRLIKVSVREPKVPEIGDKFASRHGQKGIVGLIAPEADMPFTVNGITPDIIINPHGIPSRMTVGQLLEIIAGKVGAMTGKVIDGTAFRGNEEEIRDALKKLGFRDDGKETMYNGVTGEKFEAQILVGLGFYQRLYHMVSHKIHARSRGPVALLTKQPTEGRSKEGGLRFGEMEKDCLIAHGAAITLKERFGSDKTEIPICTNCGITALHDRIKGKLYCPVCKGTKVQYAEMSHAFKLLVDEMRTMMMNPRLIVEGE